MPVQCCFAVYLIWISIYDIKYKRFPGWFLPLGWLLAMIKIVSCLWNGTQCWNTLLIDLGIGIMPGILLLIIAFLNGKIGDGDGHILILTGMIAGGKNGIIVFAWSLALAFIYTVWILVARKAGKNDSFPYIPFITASFGGLLIAERLGINI